MWSKTRQQGLTAISTLVLLVIAGFFVLLLLKLGPIYFDHFKVQTVMRNMENETLLGARSISEIRAEVHNRLYINEVRHLRDKHIRLKREDEDLNLIIKYEVREHIIGNIDALMTFSESVTLQSQ